MNLIENFKIALDSIMSNKMRSFLTMLGIIIGISSVITIVSLGQGGKNTITSEFEKIGSASLSIQVDQSKAAYSDYLTLEDIKQIKERVDNVKYVSPVAQKSGTAVSENKAKRAIIMGGTEDFRYIENYEFVYGRFFNKREAENGMAVVVIDEDAAKSMFGYADVVGKSLMVGASGSPKKAVIVGVTKSSMGIFGGKNDNIPAFISMPVLFYQQLFPTDYKIDTAYIIADKKENLETAGFGAKSIIESRHNNRGKEIYSLENTLKQLDQVNKVLSIFTAFISAVAAISLLVGGIGVMNIMLVSVTERTREIGIRKAIGATTGTILIQFLTESVIISLIGGIIGMLAGILGASLIGRFAHITPSLSITVIIGTILFSSAVGIFFGIYPARKAAALNPIDALRYE